MLFKGLVSHCLNRLLISNNIIVLVIVFRLAYHDGLIGCSPECFFFLCTQIVNKQSTQVFELPTSTMPVCFYVWVHVFVSVCGASVFLFT